MVMCVQACGICALVKSTAQMIGEGRRWSDDGNGNSIANSSYLATGASLACRDADGPRCDGISSESTSSANGGTRDVSISIGSLSAS